MAVDVKQQKSVYRRWLDWYCRYDALIVKALIGGPSAIRLV